MINQQAEQLSQSLYHEQAHRHLSHSVSTNSELIEAISRGQLNANQLHLLTADTQSSGRGQHGRSWQSPKGNVYLSLYYPSKHPYFPLTSLISGLLSLCVGYYLAKLPIIEQINQWRKQQQQPLIGVKWANDIGYYQSDIYSENKPNKACFYKLAGILIEPIIKESQFVGMVVGVGLNVQQAPTLNRSRQEGMGYHSTCLADLLATAENVTQEKLEEPILEEQVKVADLYQPISRAIFQAILTHQQISQDSSQNKQALHNFLQQFAQTDILYQRQIEVTQDNHNFEDKHKLQNHYKTQNSRKLKGKAMGINRFGCLQLQAYDGKVCDLFVGNIDVVD